MPYLTILLSILLSGCVSNLLPSNTHKLNNVGLGMTKQEVIQILGSPDTTKANQGIEYMIYILRGSVDTGQCVRVAVGTLGIAPFLGGCPRAHDDYFVQLEQGKVTAYPAPMWREHSQAGPIATYECF